MKKVKILFCVMLLGLVFFVETSNAAEKFASVDLAKILSGYTKAKDYEKTLDDKMKGYEVERNKMVNEAKQLQEKISLLSDKEKETKKADLENKLKSLQEFDQQKQIELRKEQEEKTKELLADVTGVIRQFAEKEGYTIVLNRNAVLYQGQNMDVTNKIVDLLGKGSKESTK